MIPKKRLWSNGSVDFVYKSKKFINLNFFIFNNIIYKKFYMYW